MPAGGGGSLRLVIVYDRIEEAAANLERGASEIVRKTIFDGEAYMKDLISQGGSGRTYGGHTASAPGEPPATDTGQLVNSIHGVVEDSYYGYVAVDAEHGAYMEYGTRTILPRPFVTPTAEALKDGFEGALEQLVNGLV
jgi:hypothetical protein